MISEKALKSLFKKNAIDVFAASNLFEIDVIELEIENAEEFVQFCTKNTISSIFYEYLHFSPSPFLIDTDEDYVQQFGSLIVDNFADEISSYNKNVLNQKEGKIFGLCLCGVLDGVIVAAMWMENYLKDNGIFYSPQEALADIVSSSQDKMTKLLEEQQDYVDRLEDELKYLLFEDEEFRVCKNQTLRKKFLKSLYNSDSQYLDMITELEDISDNFETVTRANAWIEDVWREYKASK